MFSSGLCVSHVDRSSMLLTRTPVSGTGRICWWQRRKKERKEKKEKIKKAVISP